MMTCVESGIKKVKIKKNKIIIERIVNVKSKGNKILVCCEKGEEGGQKKRRAAQSRVVNSRLRRRMKAVAIRERSVTSRPHLFALVPCVHLEFKGTTWAEYSILQQPELPRGKLWTN